MQKSSSFILLFTACGLVACGLLHGQDSLTLSSANATAGGTVTLSLTLSNQPAATSEAALQWAITYPGGDVSSMTAASGAAAAGMTVTCAQAPTGYNCVLWGMNANVIGNGVVASLTFNLTAAASTFQVTLGRVGGVSPSGEPVALSATSGSITVGGSSGGGGGSGQGIGTISSVSCAPATVVGGASSTCTVTLSASAGSGGATISLASNSTHVTVPATLTIAAGNTSGTFAAATTSVASVTAATIVATLNSAQQTATLTVDPADPPAITISSVSCAPATVVGGASSTCTVNLSANAGSGGATISLASNSAQVTVPATLMIAANKNSGAFTATTISVANATAATIAATLNSLERAATLTVDPAVPLSGLSCGVPVGSALKNNSSVTCTVTLAGPAPAAETIALASNVSAVTVPASVTVPSGATTATFVAQSGKLNAEGYEVTITASAGGVQETVTFLVRAEVSSVACVPTAIMAPTSTTTTCTVTLTQAVPAAIIITLASSSPYLTVPSTLTLAAGHSSGTFNGTAGSAPYTVVEVSAAWGTTVSATVSVGPVPVKSVSCSPSRLTPGKSATCTVTLVGSSPAGGETVTTSSANASLSVPASVTVPAGATSATFSATALTGYAASAVQITASIGGASAGTVVNDGRAGGALAQSSGTLVPIGALRAGDRPAATDKQAGAIVVSAAAPAQKRAVGVAPQLSCAPQDVEAGGTLTCEVQLGTASARGVEISVSSSHPSLHVPAGIISRPYQSSVSFQALVDAGAPPQTMTIQAALGSPGTSHSNVAQSQIAVQPSAVPVLNAPGAQKTLFGAKLSFRVTAASGSGQALAVRADRLPPGAAFDPATGDFEWTASPAQSGRWETVFTTTDELGRSATANVPIQAGSGGPEIDHVENAASGSRETVCASGSLATIRGAWLANGSASDLTGTAMSLAGTEVLVDGQTAPVVFVSPTEVTFVCPRTETSEVSVSVETAMAVSAPATAAVAASAPGIFTADGSRSGQATATIFEGSRLAMPRNYRYPSQPAQAGDNLSILMTGVAADADPSTLTVRIGDVETHATSIRPVVGAAGVVQVELTIPGAASVGNAVPIRVRQGLPGMGVPESQTATIAIEPSR